MSILLNDNNSMLIGYQLGPKMIKHVESSIPKFESLLNIKPEINLFGRLIHENRDVGFFSDESAGYKYSNKIEKSKPLDEYLTKIMNVINSHFESKFNGILINRYCTGLDYIGKHSDDERGLDSNAGVVVVSYGADRIFRIRDKKNGKIILDISTSEYPVIQMAGDFQKYYTHEVPIQRKVKDTRYSFTFRKHTS